MPKSRKKRNSQKDFQKVKFKVGKKIQKADNVTNTSFHTRTIQVTQKIKTATSTEPSTKRKLNAGELLNQFQHYSTTTRHDAVMGLRELLSLHPEVVTQNLVTVMERTAQLFVDKDPVVRQANIKLLKVLFKGVTEKYISPFFHIIGAHLCCAMTHIFEDIQSDSLQILDLLLDHFPRLVITNSNQILPNFIEQISRQRLDTKSGSSALSINPNLKMASHKWRAKVLTRLHKLLSAILENDADASGKTSIVFVNQGIKSVRWKKDVITQIQPWPKHFISRWQQPAFVQRSQVNTVSQKNPGVSLSDEPGLKRFVQLIIPLLIECWIESSSIGAFTGKGLNALVTADSLPLRTSVVNVIQLLCQYVIKKYPSSMTNVPVNPSMENQCESDNRLNNTNKAQKGWLRKCYFTELKNHLMKDFPYSVHIVAKKKEKLDNQSMQDAVCNLNVAVCDIMTHFLSGEEDLKDTWEITVVKYLEDVLSQDSQDRQRTRVVIEIINRLVKRSNTIDVDSIVGVMIQKYKRSHPLSADKKLLFNFFAEIVLHQEYKQKIGADIIDTFMNSLPDLFIDMVSSNQEMATHILKVMKTAACQNCWILLQQLNKFICKTAENGDILKIDVQSQKSLLELVFYVPQLQKSSLKVYANLVRNVVFPIHSALYILQIVHHRYSTLDHTPNEDADYISFMMSVLLGVIDGEKGDRYGCEINEGAANNFLTESKQWERTLVLSEAVSSHLTQYGDTEQMVQILSGFLQKWDSSYTDSNLISLIVLSNQMEFYNYPVTSTLTESLIPHFWAFCKKITATRNILLNDSMDQFKNICTTVLQKMVESVCCMENGLCLLVKLLKENLHDNKTIHLELKKVCQTGSLWICHYDSWIERSKTHANMIPEISTTVSLIQKSYPELREQQWWSDFSFLVSRLKI
ncbi:testis-expressed protein 10-like [Mytilus californianus]|uniref:testis-expressed protein 10-like n=1 Tax=Mytilus californianus TaxID=6549 RepID=UPI00224683D8|nr:testis-expressed protein 10-like [Mytilus californianus]